MDKKITFAALALGVVISGSALANTGTVNFIGSISDTTCDIVGEQGGAQGSTISLGTYTVADVNGDTTGIIDFSLAGTKSDGSACALADGGFADITWTPASGAWDANGLQNTGTATGAAVKLMDKDSVPFSAVRDTVTYAAADAVEGKLPFKAQLVKSGTATAGTVTSSVKFAVAYK
ncbi:fimbrial protein [Photobacterium damselae]|uniref:fimbrial protein n=1 Tax=Photobacterium damselae TaxID=38293 RepID=UPI002F4177BB